jgi:hypothetical protein
MTRLVLITGVLLGALFAPARLAGAADVSAEVSSREVFVGVPFSLKVLIENSGQRGAPQLPDLPGLEVISGPNQSSSSVTQIIQGRVTQRQTVTVSYQLVARQPGSLTIGPISVVADGETFRTRPIQIVATTSQTGDLLLLEVVGDWDTYYLGETIPLTLEIWLKPYHDRRSNLRLDSEQMWKRIDGRATSLGPFADYQPPIRVRSELREDNEGVKREYFVYELRSSFVPQQAGALTFDDVRVVVRYPVEVQRRRSFFESGWEVSRTRPLVATVPRADIEIKAPPAEGRPASFTGAVGRFDFAVSAKPTDVVVGDPVTLTMTIADRTPGTARLEALRPPDLHEVRELSEGFRVPTDPLAGVVDGRRKTFTQTIRARDENVRRIPPIPFAYFDPVDKRYVTSSSNPIPLTVAPATEVSVNDVVGFDPGSGGGPTELTEVTGGILANYSGPALLVSQPAFVPSWAHGAAVVVPPVAFGIVAVGRRRARRLRDDRGYARRRSARRRALGRLREARHDEPPRQAEATAQALGDYVADRCNLPAGALTGAEVVERLRQADVAPDLVADVEALLAACEQLRYAGASGGTDGIAEKAARCIDRLERERIG